MALSENRLQKIDWMVTAVRVRTAVGKRSKATADLLAGLASARKMGCVRCEFEVRLALSDLEATSVKTANARTLVALEKDATAKSFFLIASRPLLRRRNPSNTLETVRDSLLFCCLGLHGWQTKKARRRVVEVFTSDFQRPRFGHLAL